MREERCMSLIEIEHLKLESELKLILSVGSLFQRFMTFIVDYKLRCSE